MCCRTPFEQRVRRWPRQTAQAAFWAGKNQCASLPEKPETKQGRSDATTLNLKRSTCQQRCRKSGAYQGCQKRNGSGAQSGRGLSAPGFVYRGHVACLIFWPPWTELSLLRELRVQAGICQVDMARALSKPQAFVSYYESGARRLDLLELRQVCKVLGVSLLGGRRDSGYSRRLRRPASTLGARSVEHCLNHPCTIHLMPGSHPTAWPSKLFVAIRRGYLKPRLARSGDGR